MVIKDLKSFFVKEVRMIYSPKKLKELLNKYNFKLKKRYGQNFIIDENIIEAIIQKSKIDQETLIIEVGPGAGALTNKLALVAKRVLTYEIDINLKEILDINLKEHNNITIIYEDFLKADILKEIKKYQYQKVYLVANLPYYITTPIIIKIMKEIPEIEKIIIMVQKEIGDRFQAKPGTREYNSLSVLIDYFYDVKRLLNIKRTVFIPQPNVDSIVLELKRKEIRLPLTNKTFFFQIVKDSFKQKRKIIKNNLKDYNLAKIEKVLKKHNLDLSSRAEQVPLEVFVEISNFLTKNDNQKQRESNND